MKASGKLMVESIAWRQLGEFIAHGIGMLIMILVSRSLSPEVVGKVAIAISIGSMTVLIAKFGFGSALVVFQERKKELIDTCFTGCLILGLIVSIILASISGPLAEFYSNQDLSWLINVVAIGCIFSALESVPIGLLERDLRFSSLTFVRLFRAIILLSITAFMLFKGYKEAALIYPLAFASFCSFLCSLLLAGYVPRLKFNFEGIRQYFDHIRGNVAHQVFSFLSNNMTTIVMGLSWPAASLGIFSLAQRANDAGSGLISTSVVSSYLPILAKLDPKSAKFHDFLVTSCHYQRILLVPLFVIAAFNSTALVTLVFGDPWAAAGPVLFYFLVTRIITFCLPPAQPIMYANQRAGLYARIVFCRLLLISILSLLAYSHSLGLMTYMKLMMFIDIAVQVPAVLVALSGLGCSVISFFRMSLKGLVFIIIFCGFSIWLKILFGGIQPQYELFLMVGAQVVFWLLSLVFYFRTELSIVMSVVKGHFLNRASRLLLSKLERRA